MGFLVCSTCGSRFGHLMNDDHITEAHKITVTSIQPIGSRAIGPEKEAKEFVKHFYLTFDTNRLGLAKFYQENSMLTLEGQKIMGVQNIIAKLTAIDPLQLYFKHSVKEVDCPPSGPGGDMLVFLIGKIQLPGEQLAWT